MQWGLKEGCDFFFNFDDDDFYPRTYISRTLRYFYFPETRLEDDSNVLMSHEYFGKVIKNSIHGYAKKPFKDYELNPA